MTIRSEDELETLRECGRRLAAVLSQVMAAVRPGTRTIELDQLAERLIHSSGGEPVFKGYRTRADERLFPASLCVSINDEVVHGIPRHDRLLREGDIVGLDIGMRWPASQPSAAGDQLPVRGGPGDGSGKSEGGLITDMAVTVPVGRAAPQAEELLAVTREALTRGIAVLRPGAAMGDLGNAIQRHIEANGFSVVRELVGHGVGRHLHENPHVPNYGQPGDGIRVREGMVLAIEPMATAGSPLVRLDRDGWTWRTRDGSLAAHFEHTVVVMKDGAEVLTTADRIS